MMKREARVEFPSDPSLFSPLQIHPRELLGKSLGVKWVWLRKHVASFPEFLTQHQKNWVIVGAHLDYHEPFVATDADAFEIAVEDVRLRRNDSMLDVAFECRSAAKHIATIRILSMIVKLEDEAMSATPSQLTGALRERFTAMERDGTSTKRIVPELLSRFEQSGEIVGRRTERFSIHRHHCEVADMWCFVEIPRMVSEVRERMVLEDAERAPRIRDGMIRPVGALDLELRRPFYLFDEGRIEASVYAHDEETAFVYTFMGKAPDDAIRGVVVERFRP